MYSVPSRGFILDYLALLERWATWAEHEVQQWPDAEPVELVPVATDVFRVALDQDDDEPSTLEGAPNRSLIRRDVDQFAALADDARHPEGITADLKWIDDHAHMPAMHAGSDPAEPFVSADTARRRGPAVRTVPLVLAVPGGPG